MKINTVILWTNDMTMVFDEAGEQVPELQGPYSKTRDLILAAADDETAFSFGVWHPKQLLEVPREFWARHSGGEDPAP